jgi:Fe-S cluster assembly iron-binding protein IscA
MFELSESARKELEAYFAGRERGTIRVYLAPGGCCGPRLALGLDAAQDDDRTFSEGGFDFCINGGLLSTVGGIAVDLAYTGLTVTPSIPLSDGAAPACGGCSGCAD